MVECGAKLFNLVGRGTPDVGLHLPRDDVAEDEPHVVLRTGSVAPDKIGGRRRPALDAHRDWVLARIAEKPDLTLRALAAELSERGVQAGQYAVWSFFQREGMTFKKNTPRGRTGPAGRGQEAGEVEAPPK